MADQQKEKDDRLRRTNSSREKRTDTDTNFVAVNTLPGERKTGTPGTTMTSRDDDRPLTKKIGDALTGDDRERTDRTGMGEDKTLTEKISDTLHEAKEDVKDAVTPGRTDTDRSARDERLVGGTTMTRSDVTPGPTKKAGEPDWDAIQHPGGCGPGGETDYGTRPISELTPPSTVTDKADLAAVRMMEKENLGDTDRERIMSTATLEAATARNAMAKRDTARTSPTAAERTTRAGAAISTEPAAPLTTEKPVTGTRVSPGITTAKPLTPYGTVNESTVRHARDETVHEDWERFPQINAPENVGIPTPEGQDDARRIAEGRRRSNEDREPRLDRRGNEISAPAASRANLKTMRDEAKKTGEEIKDKARDTRDAADRKA
jgi:gas vesicle protein